MFVMLQNKRDQEQNYSDVESIDDIEGKPTERKPKKVYREITENPGHIFYVEKVVDWEKRIADYPESLK